jgi:hypothetical protein
MIEKLWSKTKGYVAAKDHAGRTPTQMRADLLVGLYGDNGFSGITAADCRGYIAHAIGTANAWLQESDTLTGLFAPCVAPAAMTVDALTERMRARYRDARPLRAAADSVVHSDDSATDDTGSDSDYE